MLPTGMRDSEPNFTVPDYMSLSVRLKSPNDVETVQDAIKKLGFNTFSILDATRNLRRFFAVLDPSSDLWQPGVDRGGVGNREYAGDGHFGAAPRNRNHEGDWRERWRREEALLRRGGRDGLRR